VDLAEKKKDRATFNLLQWYVDEQVEEEANDEEIIQMLKMIGNAGHGLMMLDRELAQRTYTPLVTQKE
ncbi:MAG: ferritin, partial [Euryarchaeota archaeon]|nr:ferritin [Euryarchaeota archaeon]